MDMVEVALEVLDMGAEVEAELPIIEVTKVLQHFIMILTKIQIHYLAIIKLQVAKLVSHVISKLSRLEDLKVRVNDLKSGSTF